MLAETRKYEERSRAFAVRVIRLVRTFPTTPDGLTVARQLVRAATGVAGNYRASYWSRSRTEFAARLSVVVEEADESVLRRVR
jgi:four helix bundle protein